MAAVDWSEQQGQYHMFKTQTMEFWMFIFFLGSDLLDQCEYKQTHSGADQTSVPRPDQTLPWLAESTLTRRYLWLNVSNNQVTTETDKMQAQTIRVL